MSAIFKEDKEFKACYGDPPVGNFALDFDVTGRVHWDHCREQFASKFDETINGFYFSHPEYKSHNCAEFLTKFENVVGIYDSEIPFICSSFAKTSKSKITWVEPSNFWIEHPIKRSLLTIILRCGINYDIDKDNFEDTLFSEEYKENVYLRDSKSATMRFMFGFTEYCGELPTIGAYTTVIKHGWREEFSRMNDDMIRKKLRLPKNQMSECSVIGIDALWN